MKADTPAPLGPVAGLASPDDREFALLRGLIHREAGIYLSEAKKTLLVGRLASRMRELGIKSFGAYYHRAVEDDAERLRLIDAITTNETHFFRESRHFELVTKRIVPRLRHEAERRIRTRRVRAWSAACATGEEPFSLAMELLTHLPPSEGWEIDILASDLSTRALERARSATWPMARTREIPEHYLKAYMLRGIGSQEGMVRAAPELRALVRFERINLNDASYPGVGRFDLLFCRNVLIYFHPDERVAVAERLAGHLAPGGHLFFGHAESLAGRTRRLVAIAPGVYRQSEGADREAHGGRSRS